VNLDRTGLSRRSHCGQCRALYAITRVTAQADSEHTELSRLSTAGDNETILIIARHPLHCSTGTDAVTRATMFAAHAVGYRLAPGMRTMVNFLARTRGTRAAAKRDLAAVRAPVLPALFN